MKKLFVILAVLIAGKTMAQHNFLSSVHIEYEKTVAPLQLYKELSESNEWFDIIKQSTPASVTSYFEFIGDTAHSSFRLFKEAQIPSGKRYDAIADNNNVYIDYANATTITQKPVFEETFLIQDSLMKIKWKITSDTRNIAGFECRKAIGTLFDSLTIFAFYTDEILIPGGPESINGLPGMILGLGIPRLHTTWFATKVELADLNKYKVAPATKGKKMSRPQMEKSLRKVLDDWGSYGKKLVLNYLI